MPAPRRRRVRAHNPWGSSGRADLALSIPAWTKDALCTEIGVDVFFNDSANDQTTRLAKETCRTCPVHKECLEMALDVDEWNDQYGVFGGTGPKERRELRRERKQREVAA